LRLGDTDAGQQYNASPLAPKTPIRVVKLRTGPFLRGSFTHQFWHGPLSFSINPQPPASRCDLFFGGGVHECKTKAVTTPRWRLFFASLVNFDMGLCRQIGTGGLHCPVLTQRRLALFSLAALCVWRTDPPRTKWPRLAWAVQRAGPLAAAWAKG
jgi:hypothetical protein